MELLIGGYSMESKRLLPIAILVLAFSIIFSGLWIGSRIDRYIDSNNISIESKGMISLSEAAEYLGISESEFELILREQIRERAGLGVFDTYAFIPFMEIRGTRYFSVDQLDKWLEHNMITWKRFNK